MGEARFLPFERLTLRLSPIPLFDLFFEVLQQPTRSLGFRLDPRKGNFFVNLLWNLYRSRCKLVLGQINVNLLRAINLDRDSFRDAKGFLHLKQKILQLIIRASQIADIQLFIPINSILVIIYNQMSFKASIEIILQLHCFKNIALPHRAKYCIAARIYQGKHKKSFAMPYNLIENIQKSKKLSHSKPQIDDLIFKSKSFSIAYHQQEFQINDICQFKMNLEAFPSLQDNDMYIEFTLMQSPESYYKEDDEPVDFVQAEVSRFKVQMLESGVLAYCQGQFTEKFVSQYSFTFFAMITDYKFASYSAGKTQSIKQLARQKVDDLKDFLGWCEEYYKSIENPGLYFYQTYVKGLRYNSFLIKNMVNQKLKNSKNFVELKAPLGHKGQIIQVNEKVFFDYITNYAPENINDTFIKREIYSINEQNFYFILTVIEAFQKSDFNQNLLKQDFFTQRREKVGERIFKNVIYGKSIAEGSQNIKISKKMRKKKTGITQVKLVDENMFLRKDNEHYAFLQINLPNSLRTKEFQDSPTQTVIKQLSQLRKMQMKTSYDERNMLIVYVHGFQASSYDMEVLKRQIQKVMPVAHHFISSGNEFDTNNCIDEMGLKLSTQIKNYVNKSIPQDEVIINFVGHSMGGIISRASLQYLTNFKHSQFGFFFSLSSPHLGYLNGVDGMVKTGLWFIRKFQKSQSLDQLAMEQNNLNSLRQSFLYKLSKIGHLRNFQKIIFLSSTEDSYVPWHSARVSLYDSKNQRSKVQSQMVQNILGDQIVHRIDLHFNLDSTKDIDSFIGRKAHINLICQDSIMKFINIGLPNLFDIRQI